MPLTSPVEEILHGTTVMDPFRWLEDRSSAETEKWIRDQQGRCDRYFAANAELAQIERRVRHYLDVEVIDQPVCAGGIYYYRKRAVGQEQSCLYRRRVTDGLERLLVDPSREGIHASVGIHRISPTGRFMAFEARRGGEDRKEIRILDIDSGAILPDRLPPGYGRGIAFSGNGYFYCHESGTNAEHTVRYHPIGSAREDAIVFSVPRRPASRLILVASEARLGAICLHPEGGATLVDFWCARLDSPVPIWSEIFGNRRAPYSPILWHDRIFALVPTASQSSKLIELSSNGDELGDFVPEKQTPIRQIALTRERLFLGYIDRGEMAIDGVDARWRACAFTRAAAGRNDSDPSSSRVPERHLFL